MFSSLLAFALVAQPARPTQARLQDDVACNEPTLPDTFSARPDTVLRVSVADQQKRPVACLTRNNFQVHEDGTLQNLSFFSSDDLPITVGFVVDARQTGFAGFGRAFARASRDDDEFFAIGFNGSSHDLLSADDPFTHEGHVLHDAFLRMPGVRGGSALYDAIVHGLDYAARGRLDQRVLIVVADGPDTASRATLSDVLDRVALSPTVIYTIRMRHGAETEPASDALEQVASLSGGESFAIQGVAGVTPLLQSIALDLRTSYTIGYVRPNPEDQTRVRHLQIEITGTQRDLRVRYRRGYVSGPAQAQDSR